MKAVIIAGGKGTRMLPLTEKVPKVLVEVNGKPFLYYVLKNLQQAGCSEWGIVVGYKQEMIAEFLEEYGFTAVLIDQKEQQGTGHALLQAKAFAGKESFLALGGDNLWSTEDFRTIQKADEFTYVCGVETAHPERYGVLVTKGDTLLEIREKPKEKLGNLINTGLYKFTPEIFAKLEKITVSPRGELELTDAVTMLAGEKKVKVVKAKWWLDLGTLEDIPMVERFLKKKDF